MEIVKLPVRKTIKKIMNCVDLGKEVIILCLADETVIGHGIYEDAYDGEYCRKNKIPMLNANFSGGACVIFEGDINFVCCHKGFSDFGKRAIEVVREYLKQKGLPVTIEGNDLIVNEDNVRYKVGSTASTYINDDEFTETVVHISITVDNDLIERICRKPMEKIPKGLLDYKVTASEILKYLSENMVDFEGVEL